MLNRSYFISSEPFPGCLLQCQHCVGGCHLSMFELYHVCCVTSVFHVVAGETAAACGALEREAVFLLCGHAAQQPSDTGLVGAALDMLAARLNYPSRSSLMCLHAQTLVFDWCSHDYSLHHFLAIQVSTCCTSRLDKAVCMLSATISSLDQHQAHQCIPGKGDNACGEASIKIIVCACIRFVLHL